MACSREIKLNNLTSDDVFDLLDGISDEQAVNSDNGGDSDAEDIGLGNHSSDHNSYISRNSTAKSFIQDSKPSSLASCTPSSSRLSTPNFEDADDETVSQQTPSTSRTTSRQKRRIYTPEEDEEIAFDSDDSVKDPDYIIADKKKR